MTYTTEEGTVGYVLLDASPAHDNDTIVGGIKYDTMAEAIAEIVRLGEGEDTDHHHELRVFEVMGIDREAELDIAEDLAHRHGHALISDEAVRELGPTLAAAEEEVANQ